ncbi:hypothetical protein AYI68_g1225 [Smittium mucronatum]|uniref:Uncharacterized protein n=1 Tax=Smittium mucronatum TaxID=133383 RepID=A0A1R0H5Z8_9FUNG|nr:hypothetical protein AYI68_g1225 [Smittium mucronatum]
MRFIFSEIAATITQGRVYNLHKGLEFIGKPDNLIKSDTKSLMNLAILDALIANKKPEKRYRMLKTFLGHQKAGTQDSNISKSAPAHNNETAITTTATNNHPQSSNFRGRRRDHGRGSQGSDPVQGSEPEKNGFRGEPKMYFCSEGVSVEGRRTITTKRLSRVYEKADGKIYLVGPPAIDALSAAQQAEDQPRGLPDPDRRGLVVFGEERNQGSPKK